jgi:uncharacterized protein with FMN-binding domain
MKRAILLLAGTAVALVMLLGYRVPAPTSVVAQHAVAASGDSTTTATAPSTGSSATSTTVSTGDSISTRWGPVQVAVVTDSSGTLVDVQVLDYPDSNGRDLEINTYALPVLKDEALAAQSATIDVVSGATYTSHGYAASLQSALDKL